MSLPIHVLWGFFRITDYAGVRVRSFWDIYRNHFQSFNPPTWTLCDLAC